MDMQANFVLGNIGSSNFGFTNYQTNTQNVEIPFDPVKTAVRIALTGNKYARISESIGQATGMFKNNHPTPSDNVSLNLP